MTLLPSLRKLLVVAATLSVVFGYPAPGAAAVIEPRATIPSEDPFYQAPPGFESAPLGSVLRQRKVISSFFGLVPNLLVETHQLLYRTAAVDGSPIATVTTVFKPLSAKSDRFVAFNTAYDSSATICSPSYQYQFLSQQSDLVANLEYVLLQAYLLSGYIVASADYEGPEAAFTPGRLAARGTLDGMRAVVNFRRNLGLSANPMIVGVGYSGGAIANTWAAALQPTYAPELNVKGWASGGTPANLTRVLEVVDGSLWSGFLPGALAGLSKPTAYGARLRPFVDAIVTPFGRETLAAGDNNCAPENLIGFAGKSVLSTEFQSLGPKLLYDSVLQSILEENTLGVNKSETPTAPVLLYHAQEDEIIPYSLSTKLQQAWCGNGADVKLVNYAAGGHISTDVVGLPRAVEFTAHAFDGTLDRGCSQETVLDDKLSPLALALGLEPLLAALGTILLKLGKKDGNLINDIALIKG